MATVEANVIRRVPPAVWGSLPARMRVLYVTTRRRTGGWLADAFAADSASTVDMETAIGIGVGLARLRAEIFDAILISHEPGELDALEMIEGIRAGSPDQAIIVLGAQSEPEMAALCYEIGGDGYACVNTATTRALIWTVARAIERHNMIAENRRLHRAEEHRLQHEHQEVARLLAQQRTLISNLESIRDGDIAHGNSEARSIPEEHDGNENTGAAAPIPAKLIGEDQVFDLPEQLISHYRELLRTYVIMGAGNLGCEMTTLSQLFVSAGVTAKQTMLLHLKVLEELIRGLGNRSARHVMNRADLLAMEVIVHLAEGYRERYFDRIHPPRQLMLKGLADEA